MIIGKTQITLFCCIIIPFIPLKMPTNHAIQWMLNCSSRIVLIFLRDTDVMLLYATPSACASISSFRPSEKYFNSKSHSILRSYKNHSCTLNAIYMLNGIVIVYLSSNSLFIFLRQAMYLCYSFEILWNFSESEMK